MQVATPETWETLNFTSLILDNKNKKQKIQTSDYLETGEIPIIDQGQDIIAGYTNDTSLIYNGDLPVIVFGDHTLVLKFIDFPFAIGADGTKIIHPNQEKCTPKFFYYAINAKNIQSEGYKRHFSKLRDQTFLIPTLPEQKQIVSILSNVDDTIQKTDQIIKQTQRLRQGLIDQIVQKGIRITLFTYTKNQPIPAKHQLVKLHEAVQINPKYQWDQNKEYPFVEMAAINKETKIIDYLGSRKLDSGYSVFKNDDVLFAHITPSTEHGKVTLAKDFKEIGLGSTELTVLKPKEIVDKDFLSYYVQTSTVRNFAVSQMEGSTGRQRVPTKVFTKDLYILLLPLPEQKQIASILSNIDTQIQKEKLYKSNLERLKKGLMQKLLTGQIRVKA
jgi:type I restriction enzyme, S subunit